MDGRYRQHFVLVVFAVVAMVNVSAEGSCTVTPQNPTTLTATGGALPNGTMNVMIQCNCTYDNGTVVGKVRWYNIKGKRLFADTNTNKVDLTAPHFTKVGDSDTHVILVIPTFNDSYDGTYKCGNRDTESNGVPGLPTVDVILTIEDSTTQPTSGTTEAATTASTEPTTASTEPTTASTEPTTASTEPTTTDAVPQCTITPLNPTTLTATGEALVSGTMNVRIQCVCPVTGDQKVRWYDVNGNFLNRDGHMNYVAGSPYYIRSTDNPDTEATLVIPTFTDSYDGTYNCGIRVNDTAFTSPSAAVTLTIACPSLNDPSNGMITCSLRGDGVPDPGDTCTYTCNTGYVLTNSNTTTCQSDGSWSNSDLVCSRTCPSLTAPSNGMITCSLEVDGVPSTGDTCTYICNNGYVLTGSHSRTCQSDGSWSGSAPICRRLTFTLVSSPAGTPVSGSTNTFDYPILSSVTLMCNVAADDGLPVTGTSYRWNTAGCYTHPNRNNGNPTCFPDGQTTQNVTDNDVTAEDAGTITCTVTISGNEYTSGPFTLRISGIALIGVMGSNKDIVSTNAVLDYSYVNDRSDNGQLTRCVTGLGPNGTGDNTAVGGVYFNGTKIPNVECRDSSSPIVRMQSGSFNNVVGVINTVQCRTFSTAAEGIYTCIMMNSSMMSESIRFGVYFTGRTAPTIDTPSSSPVTVNIGFPLILSCTSRGSPPDTFTWRKDGGSMLQSITNQVNYTSTSAVFRADYSIDSVTTNDSGTYTCTVTNPIGSDSATITVVVTTPGGSSEGGGSSAGAIAGGVIGGLFAAALIIIVVIIIVIFLRRYRDKTSYQSDNYKKPEKNNVPLKDIPDANSYEPKIIGLSAELRAIEGQMFSFPSHVTGKPAPDVYWYLNSRDITEDDVVVISSNGQLTLTSVTKDHEGEWRCQATNSSGSTEAQTRLIVTPRKSTKPLPSPWPDHKHKPIPVNEFGEHVTMLHENNNQGFKAEYESFYNGEGMSTAIGVSPANKHKNRFANIVAYDENRVVLGPCGAFKDDYINASPIDGYKHPRCFIAAQAPVAKTVADFWRLVWQEHPPTIVMITNLKEGEKVKCVQYWPDAVGQSQTYGPLNVCLTEEFEFADYVVRSIQLENSELGNRIHMVTQYHFTTWPDHGVPEYATAILAFHRRLRGTHQVSIGPMLVHCSAGVGRTGTLITVDMALEQIKAEGVVGIYNFVDKLRHQRPNMVQSQEQYMFIHDAILESITCGNTQVSAADLQRAVTKLKQRDPRTKLTGYEQQFKVLEQVSPRVEDQVCTSALKHPEKNRPNHCHPMEKGRVILRKERSDYINASFLKGYKQDKAFIVAQSPMTNTIRDFWKMIHDRQCASVVMLCETIEDGRESCATYWPESGTITYSDVTVTSISAVEAKEFTTRMFKVTDKDSNTTHQVTQFHFHGWGAHKTPASAAGLITLIDEVQRVQRSTANKPIVVHCSNVLGRTGTFCAIFTILDRFKVEQVIDVLQTVKLLRIKRPGIVEDLDQYQFIFTVVVRFLQSFDTYDNFKM